MIPETCIICQKIIRECQHDQIRYGVYNSRPSTLSNLKPVSICSLSFHYLTNNNNNDINNVIFQVCAYKSKTSHFEYYYRLQNNQKIIFNQLSTFQPDLIINQFNKLVTLQAFL